MGHASFDFSGDVAIVTGGASGIGRAITDALTEAGAEVHVFDRAAPDARPGRDPIDVTDDAAISAAVARVLAAEGRVDHLVQCAGIARDGALWKLEPADWQAVIDVNLSGAWRVLRAVAPHMRARGRGRVVHLASINALRGKFGLANYSAAKAGLIGLTRVAARELGPKGITVNAVAPGMVESPMTADLPPEVLARAVAEAATCRLAVPTDIVAAVLFLLSDEAAHITGAVLPVDGGQLA